jgi:hypothetical protein
MTGDGRHTTLNLLLWVMVFCGFNDLSWPFWGIPISGKKKVGTSLHYPSG